MNAPVRIVTLVNRRQAQVSTSKGPRDYYGFVSRMRWMSYQERLKALLGGSISAESAGPGRGAMIKVKLRTIASKSDPSAERSTKRAFKKEKWIPEY